MSSKILVVDDNREIREVINILLSSEGYEVSEAKDGIQALSKIDEEIFDLIILDVMMPHMNGYQVCVEMRQKSNAPILFLSAKSQEGDKTLGFSSGGDDYLPKPFSYNELTARVKALLRRYHIYQGKTVETKASIYEAGELCLHPQEEEVYIKGERVSLTDLEYQILAYLFRNRKQTLSAQQIYEAIWKEPYYYSANNTIMVHIRNIRKKIETDAQHPVYIKTIWGKGYRID